MLKETNKLLKKIGSKEHFVEKSKDMSLILKSFFDETFKGFKKKPKNTKIKKEKIDKESTSYWKTELLIKKYQERKSQNSKNILKNLGVFIFPFGKNKAKRMALLIRRKVILQNITILNAKKS
jgi:hypothetical protein